MADNSYMGDIGYAQKGAGEAMDSLLKGILYQKEREKEQVAIALKLKEIQKDYDLKAMGVAIETAKLEDNPTIKRKIYKGVLSEINNITGKNFSTKDMDNLDIENPLFSGLIEEMRGFINNNELTSDQKQEGIQGVIAKSFQADLGKEERDRIGKAGESFGKMAESQKKESEIQKKKNLILTGLGGATTEPLDINALPEEVINKKVEAQQKLNEIPETIKATKAAEEAATVKYQPLALGREIEKTKALAQAKGESPELKWTSDWSNAIQKEYTDLALKYRLIGGEGQESLEGLKGADAVMAALAANFSKAKMTPEQKRDFINEYTEIRNRYNKGIESIQKGSYPFNLLIRPTEESPVDKFDSQGIRVPPDVSGKQMGEILKPAITQTPKTEPDIYELQRRQSEQKTRDLMGNIRNMDRGGGIPIIPETPEEPYMSQPVTPSKNPEAEILGEMERKRTKNQGLPDTTIWRDKFDRILSDTDIDQNIKEEIYNILSVYKNSDKFNEEQLRDMLSDKQFSLDKKTLDNLIFFINSLKPR